MEDQAKLTTIKDDKYSSTKLNKTKKKQFIPIMKKVQSNNSK